MQYVDVKTYTGDTSISDIYFVQVDRNNVLFSDGANGLWCYPGHGISTETAYRVLDLVPFLDDNNGSAGVAISACPYAPSGHFLTLFRNRVFMANPNTSTVYYSGTRTDYDRNDGDAGPPIVPDTPIKPWELWNVKLDLSRANVGHGANMVIGKQSEGIRGMAATEEGIWIFKENQIILWTWPDSAAPHEVTQGAAVQEIANNVGLVAYRTLVKHGDGFIFLGQVENGQYKVFMMTGGEIQSITRLIDKNLSEIVNASTAKAAMHGDYYLLFADTGNGVEPYIALNIKTGAAVEFDGLLVESVVTHDAYGKILVASDATIKQYPGASDIDTNGTDWYIETQRMDNSKPFHDNKFRKAWVGIDTLSGSTVTARDEDIETTFEFDDTTEIYEDTVSGRDTATINLNKRSSGVVEKVKGTANGKIRINSLGIAVRDRKAK